ncbi:Fc.00g032830.m01.CDS01 [Cosmosporella sp. VM-42]
MTRVLQGIIRPFKPSVAKPRKARPLGSTRLTPPKKVYKRCDAEERQMEEVYTYDLSRKTPPDQGAACSEKATPKRILYFAGGGWQMPPSKNHWDLCAEMVCRLPNTKVTLVSYPLAPKNPAWVSFPHIEKAYVKLLQEATMKDETVIVAGDSSGGNIALCLVLWTLTAREPNQTMKAPAAILAMCPTTDLKHDLPGIKDVEKFDPILTVDFINSTARKWCPEPTPDSQAPDGLPVDADAKPNSQLDWSFDDPRISPIRADLAPLVRRGVKIHGITGSYDVLEPDAVVFRDKCKESGVEGEWLSWKGQMHCFPLAFSYGFRESQAAVDWIVDVLGRC